MGLNISVVSGHGGSGQESLSILSISGGELRSLELEPESETVLLGDVGEFAPSEMSSLALFSIEWGIGVSLFMVFNVVHFIIIDIRLDILWWWVIALHVML